MTRTKPATNRQSAETVAKSAPAWGLAGHCIFLAVVFITMTGWTWFGWPDPLVDFGRELYVPWQIAQGKVLYRDIAYFNGPLSPYFNALVFELLGASLRSIVIANLTILAILTGLIWRIWCRMAGAFAATCACFVLLTVFSFIQLGGIGNYNFVTPYSHELTHGLLLSFAGIACVAEFDRATSRRGAWAFAAGVMLGCVFLTKPEICIPAAIAMGAGLFISARKSRPIGFKRLALAGAGLMLPPIIALGLLSLAMPGRQAWQGVCGSWRYIFDRRITGLIFYRRISGTDDPFGSAVAIGTSLLCWAAVGGVAMFLARKVGRSAQRINTILLGGCVCAAIAFMLASLNVWQQSLRALSIVAPLLALWAIVRCFRVRDNRSIILAMTSIFAAGLLAKMMFNVIPYFYGFALAMPATLVTVAAAVAWLPEALERRGGFGAAGRAVMLPVIGLFVFVQLFVYATKFHDKTQVVGADGNRFYSDPRGARDPRGRAVQLMLDQLRTLPPHATLAVVPEGVMINFLAARTNPTPFIQLMPPEVLMYGRDRIVEAFAAHPPDYLLINRFSDPAEYGFKRFDLDYAADLQRWIDENYIAAPSVGGSDFPLVLMRKKVLTAEVGVDHRGDAEARRIGTGLRRNTD